MYLKVKKRYAEAGAEVELVKKDEVCIVRYKGELYSCRWDDLTDEKPGTRKPDAPKIIKTKRGETVAEQLQRLYLKENKK